MKSMLKRLLTLALAVVMVLTVAACGGSSSSASESGSGSAPAGETASLKMGTGGTTGTYYAFGGVVSQVLASKVEGLSFDVQSTGASKANIYLIADGDADIAIVQNDVMDYAYNGTDLFEGEKVEGFSTMAAAYAEVCQIIADPSITSIEDLKGKRVSVGDVGSGVEFNARQILAAYGISFDDIVVNNLSFGDSATAYKDGKIDAFFCTAGAPTTAVTELTTTNPINVLEIDDEHAAALIAEHPFYTQYAIPANTYKGVEEEKMTVAVKATFIVSDNLSEDLVYNMTKALFENVDEITVGHAKGAELDPAYAVAGISVPFHPGAEKYFKEVGVLQ